MKILISLLISLLITVTAYAQVTVENYSNGSKKSEGRIVNGQREGIWYEFNLKGIKIAEANYVNGVKEGKYTEWYPNGKKQFEGYFKMGKLNSSITSWHSDGILQEKGCRQNFLPYILSEPISYPGQYELPQQARFLTHPLSCHLDG